MPNEYKSLCFGFGGLEKARTLEQALGKLDEEVNKGIKNGWLPQGGVCIAVNQTVGTVAQAMIKESL